MLTHHFEPPPPGDVGRVVEHLFREETGKIIARLSRIFGVAHLALAEDVVQEALIRALKTWPYHGVPANPGAWLMQVSKNLAYDVVRRQGIFRNKEAEIARALLEDSTPEEVEHLDAGCFQDDRLPLLFVCCHPVLPQESQIALALKVLCGFGIGEISSAFLSTDAATEKRLTRARQKLREKRIHFEVPEGPQLEPRLQAVLHTLYLLFNEGYKASAGPKLVKEDLCREAIRLGELLVQHPVGQRPSTHAVLALMLLNASRLPARTNESGALVRLKDQDRGRWDSSMVARGMVHLGLSAAGEDLTEYHLQAGIAACHATASTFEQTDWKQIISLYDRLLELNPSPVVTLNRALAVGHVQGPGAALMAIGQIPDLRSLRGYHFFHVALGELELELGNCSVASRHLQTARSLTTNQLEKDYLTERIQVCRG